MLEYMRNYFFSNSRLFSRSLNDFENALHRCSGMAFYNYLRTTILRASLIGNTASYFSGGSIDPFFLLHFDENRHMLAVYPIIFLPSSKSLPCTSLHPWRQRRYLQHSPHLRHKETVVLRKYVQKFLCLVVCGQGRRFDFLPQ